MNIALAARRPTRRRRYRWRRVIFETASVALGDRARDLVVDASVQYDVDCARSRRGK